MATTWTAPELVPLLATPAPSIYTLEAAKRDLMIHFQNAKSIPTDIYEHIETLYDYARQCDHVTECGMRTCISTWAFVRGLYNDGIVSPSPLPLHRKRLIGVDLNWHPNINNVQGICTTLGIEFVFRCGNDVDLDLEETDLLFIDTWHVYGHLKRELTKHHVKAKKWIIMHDTTVDEIEGESIRMKHDVTEQMAQSGYSREEICKGIWPAVQEFLDAHPTEWVLEKRYTNCNGLTVLKRIGPSTSSA